MRNLCDVSLYLDSFLLLRLETYQSIRKSPPNLSLSATRSENILKFKLIGLQKKQLRMFPRISQMLLTLQRLIDV